MIVANRGIRLQGQFLFNCADLKNLRTQLYSAAEYLELRYTSDDQKQIVVETLKDHASRAVVNTVDHLGSVTCKVNDLLDAKVDEVSDAEHRISCMNSPESSAILMPSRIAKAFSNLHIF
ncbi:hypothetical protein WN943_014825 [Citrus x changshan-huyou]